MRSPKVVYVRPGEALEIRYITHEDLDRTAADWRSQTMPSKDLLLFERPGVAAAADPAFTWTEWPPAGRAALNKEGSDGR
jgi:hypothetical protein